ncbi:hypothetical protein [Serratia proteamaculans]|uniref:hypothetical protein n=1 Tax=Serratia proteamaculans TaxID=28151 RepID=UPI0021778B21|nr:hypothetical protein [Serratia proteamaculans]CAI1564946.1 Uncharacterised protein [Serratia proteamaculans]
MKGLIFSCLIVSTQVLATTSPSFQTSPVGLSTPTETVVLVPRESKELFSGSGSNEGYYCYYDGKAFSLGSISKNKVCKLVDIKSDKPLLKLAIPQWVADVEGNGKK